MYNIIAYKVINNLNLEKDWKASILINKSIILLYTLPIKNWHEETRYMYIDWCICESTCTTQIGNAILNFSRSKKFALFADHCQTSKILPSIIYCGNIVCRCPILEN